MFTPDMDRSPPLAEVCARFGDDANRAVVWLMRFRALQLLGRDARTRAPQDVQASSLEPVPTSGDVFAIAASHPLNERWEFDPHVFFAAVEALTARGSVVS